MSRSSTADVWEDAGRAPEEPEPIAGAWAETDTERKLALAIHNSAVTFVDGRSGDACHRIENSIVEFDCMYARRPVWAACRWGTKPFQNEPGGRSRVHCFK